MRGTDFRSVPLCPTASVMGQGMKSLVGFGAKPQGLAFVKNMRVSPSNSHKGHCPLTQFCYRKGKPKNQEVLWQHKSIFPLRMSTLKFPHFVRSEIYVDIRLYLTKKNNRPCRKVIRLSFLTNYSARECLRK